MCRFCLGIAGVVLAFSFVGCSDEAEEGTKPYKGSESPEIAKLRENMAKDMKSGKYMERPTEPKPAAKPTATKPAEK
jgi:hypothetical protein